MSNLQIIEELCGICEDQAAVIRKMSAALAQLGASVAEDEAVAAARRYGAMLGNDEADRCVCCGQYVPEGRMICPVCERS